MLRKALLDFVRSPAIPVPQSAINAVLPHAVKEVQEIRGLRIDIQDGHFDAIAQLSKNALLMEFKAEATVRFVIDEACISTSEQWIVLQQLGKTEVRGNDVVDKIACVVVEGIVFSLLGVDPVQAATEGLPHITRDDDRYRVDLSTMLPSDWTDRLPKQWMHLGYVKAMRCVPGRFELALGLIAPQTG